MNKEIYAKSFEKGHYKCSKCGAGLFESDAKFDSGTRWASFRESEKEAVETKKDQSFGIDRTKILCKKCGHHLGHVFEDGKLCGDTHPNAGKRFCVLSSALKFEKEK